MPTKPESVTADEFKSAKWDELTQGRSFEQADAPALANPNRAAARGYPRRVRNRSEKGGHGIARRRPGYTYGGSGNCFNAQHRGALRRPPVFSCPDAGYSPFARSYSRRISSRTHAPL